MITHTKSPEAKMTSGLSSFFSVCFLFDLHFSGHCDIILMRIQKNANRTEVLFYKTIVFTMPEGVVSSEEEMAPFAL